MLFRFSIVILALFFLNYDLKIMMKLSCNFFRMNGFEGKIIRFDQSKKSTKSARNFHV